MLLVGKTVLWIASIGCLLVASDVNAQKVSAKDKCRIDSLLEHDMNFLKRRLKITPEDLTKINFDSLQNVLRVQAEAIELFESITKIQAPIMDNYARGKIYDSLTLVKWWSWVQNNRELLRWNAKNKTVTRRDAKL